MAAVVVADPQCVYNADIASEELTYPGFLPVTFNYKSKSFLIVQGKFFDYPLKRKFVPSKYYRDQSGDQDAFYSAMQKAVTDNSVSILGSVSSLSSHIDTDICSIFNDAVVQMFCLQHDLVSRLRFILLCAFGMLYNFVDQSKFKLLLRGGMALRMNLLYFYGPDISAIDHIGEMIRDSPRIDMDAVVIVDPSVSPDEMAAFKTVFIKVLLHSIRRVVAERRYAIICAAASGDANTTKVKIQKEGDEHSSELADISFKYADDPVIAGYGDYSQQMEYYWPSEIRNLYFTWKHPGIDQLEREYAYVIDRLNAQLKDLSDDPQKYLFTHDLSALLRRNKYDTDRFTSKRSMVSGVTAARAAQQAAYMEYMEAQAAYIAHAQAYMEAQAAYMEEAQAQLQPHESSRRVSSRRRGRSNVPPRGGKKRKGQQKKTVRRKRH